MVDDDESIVRREPTHRVDRGKAIHWVTWVKLSGFTRVQGRRANYAVLLKTRVMEHGQSSRYNPADMRVTVNGESKELPEGETVRNLLERYNLSPDKVAVELNRRILRSEKYETALKAGDIVELVTFVGGG